jgi:hypothetical protein
MGKHRLRLLVCASGSLALIAVSTLFLDWFREAIGVNTIGFLVVRIDLRSLYACTPAGKCTSGPLTNLGFYPSCASWAFFGSLAFGALVAFQAGSRLFSGAVSKRLNKIGYTAGSLMLTNALAAGYLFPPETVRLGDLSLTVDRTWAPAMLLFGIFAGLIALALSVHEGLEDDVGEYKPITIPGKTPSSPGKLTSSSSQGGRKAAANVKPLGAKPEIQRVGEVPHEPGAATGENGVQKAEHVETLRKTLSFATTSAELSAGGIEARREDGLVKLVRWGDIVGVVARRLPLVAPYDSVTFVDLVSTAGATLRILPWTRLLGDPVEGEGDERARCLVQLLAARCPEAHLDPATRTFLGSHGPAAQLPDVETLAAHDARLA